MHEPYSNDNPDLWPPPEPADQECGDAMDIVIEATKDEVIRGRPELEAAIRKNCLLILQFVEVLEHGSKTLGVLHGLMADIEGKMTSFYIGDADSERILNTLEPGHRLQLARNMVWNHVTDLLMDEDEAHLEAEWDDAVLLQEEGGDEWEASDGGTWDDSSYGEDDGNDEFAGSLPELEYWQLAEEPDEDDADEGLRMPDYDSGAAIDDIGFVRIANENRELRILYFDLVNGRFSHD